MRFAFKDIFRHETCRALGHEWRPHSLLHRVLLKSGVWVVLAEETSEQCERCQMKRHVRVNRKVD